jgi:hypothetical protein
VPRLCICNPRSVCPFLPPIAQDLIRLNNPNSLKNIHAILIFSPLDLFYGRIFSFNEILNDAETGHVIIAALIGIDCHPQMKHHMIGMLINGVTREEIESTRTLCYRAAKELGVAFRNPPMDIPSLPEK